MQYSTNLNMNKPERADQYNLDHWNENTDILDTEIQNIKDLNDNTLKTSLLNFCYPVGSLYWSSKSTDPSTLFGGTWTPIKDCFVWAKGDNDTVNATGGSKTVTLTEQQIPSHTHTFTGSEVTSGGSSATNTGSESSHTHSVTASGSISGGAYKFTGSTTYTGGAINTGKTNAKTMSGTFKCNVGVTTATGCFTQSSTTQCHNVCSANGSGLFSMDLSHRHSLTPNGSVSVTTNPTFTGSAVTSGAGSSHSHTMAHTHSVTASGTNSSTGGGQAHDNMPPYIVKYCWERTA